MYTNFISVSWFVPVLYKKKRKREENEEEEGGERGEDDEEEDEEEEENEAWERNFKNYLLLRGEGTHRNGFVI